MCCFAGLLQSAQSISALVLRACKRTMEVSFAAPLIMILCLPYMQCARVHVLHAHCSLQCLGPYLVHQRGLCLLAQPPSGQFRRWDCHWRYTAGNVRRVGVLVLVPTYWQRSGTGCGKGIATQSVPCPIAIISRANHTVQRARTFKAVSCTCTKQYPLSTWVNMVRTPPRCHMW